MTESRYRDTEMLDTYRTLHARIVSLGSDRGKGTILFTATHPGEGCSTISTNLAIYLSQLEQAKALLIEFDLLNQNPHPVIRPAREIGLTDVLLEKITSQEAIQPVGSSGLHFLPSGNSYSNSNVLFSRPIIDTIIAQLQSEFPYLIVDGPCASNKADLEVLLPHTDGVVLVVEANKTRREAVAHSVKLLNDSGARLLGVVLNKREHVIPEWIYKRL